MTDQYGCSALYLAVYLGNHQCVDILLKHAHTDVNSAGDIGWTPLIAAIIRNYPNIVKNLLEHENIKVNLKNNKGHTAVQIACERNNPKTLKLLLQHKDIDIISNIEQHYKFAKHNQDIIKILRKYEHNYAENEKSKKKQKN